MSHYYTPTVTNTQLTRSEMNREVTNRIREAERRAEQRIAEQDRIYRARLADMERTNAFRTDQITKQLNDEKIRNARLQGDVNTLRADLTKTNDKLNKHIQSVVDKETSKKQRAQIVIGDNEISISQLKDLDVNRFFPNEYTGLQSQLAVAKKNITNGDYEAALSLAQTNFKDLQDLLDQTIIANAEFNSYKEQAEESVAEAEKEVIAASKRNITYTIDDKEFETVCDTSTWSEGKYDKAKKAVEEIRKALNTLPANATTDDLKAIIKDSEGKKVELDHVVETAEKECIKDKALHAELEKTHAALLEEGWQLRELKQASATEPIRVIYDDGNGDILTVIGDRGIGDQKVDIVIDIHGEDNISDETRETVKASTIETIDPDKKGAKVSGNCAPTSKEFEDKILKQRKQIREHM